MALRVLIIEDEPLIAHDLESIVEDAGHVVVGIVRTMHAALNATEQSPTDLAVVDIALGAGSDGVETARRLREDFGVRSLFVTAQVDRRAEAMDLAWHPVGFVAKPYVAVEIVRALATADQSLSAPSSK